MVHKIDFRRLRVHIVTSTLHDYLCMSACRWPAACARIDVELMVPCIED